MGFADFAMATSDVIARQVGDPAKWMPRFRGA